MQLADLVRVKEQLEVDIAASEDPSLTISLEWFQKVLKEAISRIEHTELCFGLTFDSAVAARKPAGSAGSQSIKVKKVG